MPKLEEVNVQELERQIGKGEKGRDSEGDVRGDKKSILKSALKKTGKGIDSKGRNGEKSLNNQNSANNDRVSNSEGVSENKQKPNYKNQQFMEYSSSEELPIARKRRCEEVNSREHLEASLKKDLQQSVIPASKRGLRAKRINKAKEEDSREINVAKARKRKERNIKKNNLGSDEDLSDSSISSDNTIRTEEREKIKEHFESYLVKIAKEKLGKNEDKESIKDILLPIIREEREQSKKETIELLRENGLLPKEPQSKLNTKDLNEDPFLEDEGFVRSDISGNTTPKKSPTRSSNGTDDDKAKIGNWKINNDNNRRNSIGRKNSFKMARTSSSQERKLMNTPKRTENKEILQKQIILPNKGEDETPLKPFGMKFTPQSDKKKDEVKPTPADIMNEMRNVGRTTSTSIFAAKTGSKPSTSTPALNIPKTAAEKSDLEKIVPKSLFSKPVAKDAPAETEKSEKPSEPKQGLSIFGGPSKDVINELKASRASNNSSPVFGESKNIKPAQAEKTEEKSEPKKQVSLFTKKIDPIAEAANEDGNQEEKVKPASSAGSLFKPQATLAKAPETTTPSPILAKAGTAEVKPSGSLFGQGSSAPNPVLAKSQSSADSNPFLAKTQSSGAPKNLFSGGVTKPASSGQEGSLFSGAPKSNPTNLFKTDSKPATSLFSADTKTITPIIPATNPGMAFGSGVASDDVGMGGTTPPTQSPIRSQKEGGQLFPFQGQSKQPTGSIFGAQGSSGEGLKQGSLFGGKSDPKAFSMGTVCGSKTSFTNPQGSMFAKEPNQGQPQPSKSSWGATPFASGPKNVKKDDGLFSDSKRSQKSGW